MTSDDEDIEVEIRGSAVLQGFGSARPVTQERYDASRHRTFDGRALAVVRPTGPGTIEVTFSGEGLEPVVVELRAI